MRTLHLTSPNMQGKDVATLQQLLKNKGYLHGSVDGEYGPITAQAVYRAKYWLGYRKPNQVAGGYLLAFLTGRKNPNVVMKVLSRKRKAVDNVKLRKNDELTTGQRVVQKALTQLGQTEHPANSNRSKFTEWYKMIGPWCAMFVTWVFVMVKIGKTFKQSVYYAYVPYILADATKGIRGLMLATFPTDGILVLFDWQRDSVPDHIGIAAEEDTLRRLVPTAFKEAIKEQGGIKPGEFWCVEGNTAFGNDSNGGIVMIRKRNKSQVRAFVKVAA